MKTKYRVKCHNAFCYEPQMKKWWWLFWNPVSFTSRTGWDYGPKTFINAKEAWGAIDSNKRREEEPPPFPVYQYSQNTEWRSK